MIRFYDLLVKIITYGEHPQGSEAYLEARDAVATFCNEERKAVKKKSQPRITTQHSNPAVNEYLNTPSSNIDGTLMVGQADINGNLYGMTNIDH